MKKDKHYENWAIDITQLHVSDFNENIYNYECRLVRLAGEIKLWYKRLDKSDINKFYGHQLLRSSGASALNFGEAQGTLTIKDFIFKMGIVHKELRECRVNLRILNHGDESDEIKILLNEVTELMAISARMILNAQKKLETK
ncbi:MAG: four helix bundle protein [Bacteroidetes bacterium]|nr:four helix bundle protein [Bacteroidota bacterium]MDA0972659.1 four helix bundle protein [Bacteroidota bacterium]